VDISRIHRMCGETRAINCRRFLLPRNVVTYTHFYLFCSFKFHTPFFTIHYVCHGPRSYPSCEPLCSVLQFTKGICGSGIIMLEHCVVLLSWYIISLRILTLLFWMLICLRGSLKACLDADSSSQF
jgi:hypothetical protein